MTTVMVHVNLIVHIDLEGHLLVGVAIDGDRVAHTRTQDAVGFISKGGRNIQLRAMDVQLTTAQANPCLTQTHQLNTRIDTVGVSDVAILKGQAAIAVWTQS